MSQSLNAAKNRRAVAKPIQQMPSSAPQNQFVPSNQPNMASPPPPSPPQAGLTLPQVIALIDTRLVTLEKFMNDSKSSPASTSMPMAPAPAPAVEEGVFVTTDEFSENMVEFDNRFQLLVTEIANLKDIVLSLQKYTMDVNKMLLESHTPASSTEEELVEDVPVSE
jgi:hypothetical protein